MYEGRRDYGETPKSNKIYVSNLSMAVPPYFNLDYRGRFAQALRKIRTNRVPVCASQTEGVSHLRIHRVRIYFGS